MLFIVAVLTPNGANLDVVATNDEAEHTFCCMMLFRPAPFV
jgi:hypothetical protein